MPELPEVEIARRNLQQWWQGRAATDVVIRDEKALVDTDADTLVAALEQPLKAAERRGKYIVARMVDDAVVVIHFRMTGKIVLDEQPDPTYGRVAWKLDDGKLDDGKLDDAAWLVFKDQRRLGTVEVLGPGELADYHPIQKMGPDALDVTGPMLAERLSPTRMLKTSLLDQEVIAGLGNIAAIEVMWRQKLPPRIKCAALSPVDRQGLAETIVEFIDDVIDVEAGDEVVYLQENRLDNPFDVYQRDGQPCPRCQTTIERQKVGGRSSYFCPTCQSS